MSLPIYKNDSTEFQLMQTSWASKLNPVLAQPITAGQLLKNISLVTGHNSINTLLGRKLQGWIIVRQRGITTVYDTQDANPLPNLTLWLTSATDVSIDLYVF